MPRKTLAALYAALLLVTAGACSAGPIGPAPTDTPAPSLDQTPASEAPNATDINGNTLPDRTPDYHDDAWIVTDAEPFYGEWDENPIRAKMKYDGQWVRLYYARIDDISETLLFSNEQAAHNCSLSFHIDDVQEAVKTSNGDYAVIEGYFVVEQDTQRFHLYHSRILDSIDYDTWTVIQQPNSTVSLPAPTYVPRASGLSNVYLYPTHSQYITRSELNQYTHEEIILIRNEMYARHGCNFSDSKIRTYFEGQSWYYPISGLNASNFDASVFNEYEKSNLDTILSYEKDMGWK
ncbi:MAG: YARHG domain-containing protein [Oscillospiraceae bacterium]|nr:YARHG domain-containing protein [Oscillospiraceae bacterium]